MSGGNGKGGENDEERKGPGVVNIQMELLKAGRISSGNWMQRVLNMVINSIRPKRLVKGNGHSCPLERFHVDV